MKISEIVKEYNLHLDRTGIPVKARISKTMTSSPCVFFWETNFIKSTETIISNANLDPKEFEKFEQAEKALLEYLGSFETIGIPNPCY